MLRNGKRLSTLGLLLILLPLPFLVTRAGSAKLELRVSCDRSEYLADEDAIVQATIWNVGHEPSVLYAWLRWGALGGIALHVEDESGRPLQNAYFHDLPLPLRAVKDPSMYFGLMPGHFLGTTAEGKVSAMLGPPGRYKIWLEYQSPVERESCPTPDCWGRQDGRLKSREIWVRVKDR